MSQNMSIFCSRQTPCIKKHLPTNLSVTNSLINDTPLREQPLKGADNNPNVDKDHPNVGNHHLDYRHLDEFMIKFIQMLLVQMKATVI